jgi:protein TonB
VFQQSILSSEKSRRPWTFGVSLLAQSLFVAIAVLIPLLAEPMLPALNAAIVSLQAPKPPRVAAPPPPQRIAAVRPQQFSAVLHQPAQMPARAAVIVDTPPSIGGDRIGVVGVGPGPGNATADILAAAEPVTPPPVAEPEPARAQPIRVSSAVQAARIVRRVMPIYPALARTARISGTVRLQAIIAADGSIAELNVISGPPLLIKAATDAVQQWLYRPTVLNGRPVAVDTQIDVNFTLGR